jgi:hypothetical protein
MKPGSDLTFPKDSVQATPADQINPRSLQWTHLVNQRAYQPCEA